MTTIQPVPVPVSQRLDFDALAPVFSRAVSSLDDASTEQLDRAGIDPVLRDLIRLRASQINGCTYCVDLHARAARTGGATPQRVDAVAVWGESGLFTAAERAALALTDDITRLAQTHVPKNVVTETVAAFGEEGAAALISLITTINVWNTIGVTTRCWNVAPRAVD